MKQSTRIFVSYTLRDGTVSLAHLNYLYDNLREICHPFIHAVNSKMNEGGQIRVITELLRSHLLLIIESPDVYKSPWVRIELLLSKLKLMPVIHLPIDQFQSTEFKEWIKIDE